MPFVIDDLIIIGIGAACGALLGGGGTYVYEENKNQKKISRLQSEIDDLSRQVNDYQNRQQSYQDQIAYLQAEKGKLLQEKLELHREISKQTEVLAKMNNDVKNKSSFYHRIIIVLKSDLSQVRENLKIHQVEILALKQYLENANLEIDHLHYQIEQKETDIMQNELRFNQSQQEVQHLQSELDSYRRKYAEKKTEINALT